MLCNTWYCAYSEIKSCKSHNSHLLNGDPPLRMYKIIFNYEAVIRLQKKRNKFFLLKLLISLIRDFLSFSKKSLIRTLHNHLVHKRILNHLARWVDVQLQSLKLQILCLLPARSSLTFIECGFTLKHVRGMIRTYCKMHRTDEYS